MSTIPRVTVPYPFTRADLNAALERVGAEPIPPLGGGIVGRNETSAILDLIAQVEQQRQRIETLEGALKEIDNRIIYTQRREDPKHPHERSYDLIRLDEVLLNVRPVIRAALAAEGSQP